MIVNPALGLAVRIIFSLEFTLFNKQIEGGRIMDGILLMTSLKQEHLLHMKEVSFPVIMK